MSRRRLGSWSPPPLLFPRPRHEAGGEALHRGRQLDRLDRLRHVHLVGHDARHRRARTEAGLARQGALGPIGRTASEIDRRRARGLSQRDGQRAHLQGRSRSAATGRRSMERRGEPPELRFFVRRAGADEGRPFAARRLPRLRRVRDGSVRVRARLRGHAGDQLRAATDRRRRAGRERRLVPAP